MFLSFSSFIYKIGWYNVGMDDDYEMDSGIDSEMDEFDDESEDLGDFDDVDSSDSSDDGRDLNELEELGVMDGQQDAISGSFYTGFGMSVEDSDSLSDEERDAYETGYHTGFGAGGGWG